MGLFLAITHFNDASEITNYFSVNYFFFAANIRHMEFFMGNLRDEKSKTTSVIPPLLPTTFRRYTLESVPVDELFYRSS